MGLWKRLVTGAGLTFKGGCYVWTSVKAVLLGAWLLNIAFADRANGRPGDADEMKANSFVETE